MFPKEINKAIQKTVATGMQRFSYTNKRPYFGLSAALVLYDSTFDKSCTGNYSAEQKESLRQAGKAAVACNMLKSRSPVEYFALRRKVREAQQVAAQGEKINESFIEEILLVAQAAEERTTNERLNLLIRKHDLEETVICGLRLYLPATRKYFDGIRYEDETDQDLFFEDFSSRPFVDWCEYIEEEFYRRREELIQGETKHGRYIEQISERYLSIAHAQELLLPFQLENPEVIRGINTRALEELRLLSNIRQDIFRVPYVEEALRLQIKQDKEIGRVLDKQHNNVMLQVKRVVEKNKGFFKPTFVTSDDITRLLPKQLIH